MRLVTFDDFTGSMDRRHLVKVRQQGRIVSVAVIVAVGVNSDGRREVLGMDIGPSEAETFWTAFLRKLARRGLRGVKLVVSDAHEASRPPSPRCSTPPGSAAASTSCATRWRMPARVAGASSPPSSPPRSLRTCRSCEDAVAQGCRSTPAQAAQACRLPRRGRDRCARLYDLPPQHRTKLHSTNPIERLNGEIKRRTEVVGIFTNKDAIVRLIGAILLEQNDEWAVQRAR